MAERGICPGYWSGPAMIEQMAALVRDGRSWMSVTPLELESAEIGIRLARGHVLIFGLGMGLAAAATACIPAVRSVTVVERDADVLALNRALDPFAQLPETARAKLRVIEGDAFEHRPDGPVDYLMPDILAAAGRRAAGGGGRRHAGKCRSGSGLFLESGARARPPGGGGRRRARRCRDRRRGGGDRAAPRRTGLSGLCGQGPGGGAPLDARALAAGAAAALGGGLSVRFAGGCPCGAIRILFETAGPLAPRACQCRFCRKHNARTVTDPDGSAVLDLGGGVIRYRFGTGTTDFLICARCGVYVGASAELDGRLYATLNLNAFDDPRPDLEAAPVSYDGEDAAAKGDRRRARWTPARLG